MNKILEVIGNLKHNGELLKIGSFFEAEVEAFKDQIEAGILKIREDLSSIEETQTAAPTPAPEVTAPEKEVVPEGTWGANTDPEAPDTNTLTPESKPEKGEEDDGVNVDPDTGAEINPSGNVVPTDDGANL